MAPLLALLLLGVGRVLLGFLEVSISPLVFIMLRANAQLTRTTFYTTLFTTLLYYMVRPAIAGPVSLSSRLATPSTSLSAPPFASPNSPSPSPASPSSVPPNVLPETIGGFIIGNLLLY
ncbi:hypothetical protein L207DRAFT_566983, partial [Hyaloscypha variabilis F]